MDNYKEYLDGKEPIVGELLKFLFKKLDKITGGDYDVEKKKDSLHIVHGSAFLGVHFLRDRLRLNIVLNHPIVISTLHKIDQPSKNVYHNKIDLYSVEDLSKELSEFMSEAFRNKLK